MTRNPLVKIQCRTGLDFAITGRLTDKIGRVVKAVDVAVGWIFLLSWWDFKQMLFVSLTECDPAWSFSRSWSPSLSSLWLVAELKCTMVRFDRGRQTASFALLWSWSVSHAVLSNHTSQLLADSASTNYELGRRRRWWGGAELSVSFSLFSLSLAERRNVPSLISLNTLYENNQRYLLKS